MVKTLKNNLDYIKYIRQRMNEIFPEWEEINVEYKVQANDNFGIYFKKDLYKVQLLKDRGLLECKIYFNEEPIRLGYLLYNSILDYIPEQNPKWRLSICIELIDFYVEFLKRYFFRD